MADVPVEDQADKPKESGVYKHSCDSSRVFTKIRDISVEKESELSANRHFPAFSDHSEPLEVFSEAPVEGVVDLGAHLFLLFFPLLLVFFEIQDQFIFGQSRLHCLRSLDQFEHKI
jgi:hypothetical protein